VLYDTSFADVVALLRAGRFRAAQDAITSTRSELQRANGLAYAVISAELALELGDIVGAQRSAEKLLRDTEVSEARAISHRIIAEASAERLNFEESFDH